MEPNISTYQEDLDHDYNIRKHMESITTYQEDLDRDYKLMQQEEHRATMLGAFVLVVLIVFVFFSGMWFQLATTTTKQIISPLPTTCINK